ncbi:MAG TPA: hypothetical protein VNA67_06125, partial [Pseudonocardiaceae bacterium]|nr:hypothetical protein [Pseudonocardiaceae bacterium]
MAIGAIAVSARSLAPDVARGAMLLLIALANAHLHLYGRPVGVRGYPIPESTAERLVVLGQMTFVDGRAYPMFAFLFGYGIVQLWRRQTSKGVDAARSLGRAATAARRARAASAAADPRRGARRGTGRRRW